MWGNQNEVKFSNEIGLLIFQTLHSEVRPLQGSLPFLLSVSWSETVYFLPPRSSHRIKIYWKWSRSVVSDSATPWTIAYQALLSMGFSRQEYWSGLPFPSPGDLPNPGIEPGSPALQTDALPSEPPGKPLNLLKWPVTRVEPGWGLETKGLKMAKGVGEGNGERGRIRECCQGMRVWLWLRAEGWWSCNTRQEFGPRAPPSCTKKEG